MEREPASLTGRLRLDVQPEALLQIYVDGYYVGTADEVNRELELAARPHSIEISAPGHETLKFEVNIDAGRTITYRGALKPADVKPDSTVQPDAPDVTAQPTARSTFYFIPGCYIGNVPPQDVTLPATCDLSRLIVRTP
jgi:hypothetical protein